MIIIGFDAFRDHIKSLDSCYLFFSSVWAFRDKSVMVNTAHFHHMQVKCF